MNSLRHLVLALGICSTVTFVRAAETVEVDGFLDHCKESQNMSQWCWAACIQATLDQYGLERSQEEIVELTYGRLVDLPIMNPNQVYRTLNNWKRTTEGIEFVASQLYPGSPPGEFVVSELADGHPIIMGYRAPTARVGHAIVVYAANYTEVPGGKVVHSVKYWDPWPGRGAMEATREQLAPLVQCAFAIRGAKQLAEKDGAKAGGKKAKKDEDDDDGGNNEKAEDASADIDIDGVADIDWHPTPDNPTVDFKITYESTGERDIEGTIIVATGHRPRDADNDDFSEWEETQRKSFKVKIPAGETKTVKGKLRWTRRADTMPVIRFPDGSDENAEFLTCHYVE